MIKKRLLYLLTTCAFLGSSCVQDDEVFKTDGTNEGNNEENDDGANNGNRSTQLYFHFSSTGANLDYPAGSTAIYFESNTEWSVSLDNSHFGAPVSVSPMHGTGRGSVVVTYGEKRDHYDCSDYLYVKFRYVDKIYSNGEKHYETNTYTITRRYHRIHV